MKKYILVFDGGSAGNPGPAYGSYRLHQPGRAPAGVLRLRFGQGTNNEAEYWTLLAGLRTLLEHLEATSLPPRQVVLEVRGDSQLVLSQLNGSWKARQPKMRALRDEALDLLGRFGSVRLVHQPRPRSVAILGH
jgi:ribonuclease HI